MCVCVGIYLQLSGRLCLASHMNLIYACVCACVYVCLGTVHKSEYIAIGTITHTHTHSGTYTASCAGSFAAFKFMLHCKMPSPADWQCKEGDKRERHRGRTTSFAGQKAAVYRCMSVYVCACVCVCNTLLKVQCNWRFRWANYVFSQRWLLGCFAIAQGGGGAGKG